MRDYLQPQRIPPAAVTRAFGEGMGGRFVVVDY